LRQAGLRVQSIRYNVELMRLRDLLRSQDENAQKWQEQKNAIVSGESQVGPADRPVWIDLAKRAVNIGGNLLGMGDEIIALAVKPEAADAAG
jgi:hypothetical protein